MPRFAKTCMILMLCCAMLAGLPSFATGGPTDPVVSKSYIDKVFQPKLEAYATDKLNLTVQAVEKALREASIMPENGQDAALLARRISKAVTFKTAKLEPVKLPAAAALMGGDGTMFTVRSGTVNITGTVIDFTDGRTLSAYYPAPRDHLLGTLDGAYLTAMSEAQIEVKGYYRLILPNEERFTALADELFSMGLLLGTGKGYELERPATRSEGLLMFLRLIGEGEAATVYTGAHPFTDLAGWSVPHVSYGFAKGYTNGVSATAFGQSGSMTADMYCTFVLRALGYESEKDFRWDQSLEFAAAQGLLKLEDVARMRDFFNRDELVFLSHAALSFRYKGSSQTLKERLVQQGAIPS